MYENLIKTGYSLNRYNIEKGASNYRFTEDFDGLKAKDLVIEFTHMAKTKGLTVRQAQQVFLVCADYVLDGEYK